MIRRWFYRWFDRVSLLHTATLSVAAFSIFSLLGGAALYASESQRTVHGKQAMFVNVNIVPVPEGISVPLRQERHTVVLDTEYQGEKFIDALFISVSALSTTGLTSTDFSQFTMAGKIIIFLLINMGGIGVILFTSIFFIAVVRGLSRRDSFKTILSDILDTPEQTIKVLIKQIIFYTLFFEILGFVSMGMYLAWFSSPDVIQGINPWWWALFHSVSAFNSAGFSLLPSNLTNFVNEPFVPFVLSLLIIAGGLGFPVIIALHVMLSKWFGRQQIPRITDIVASPVQVKVVLMGTLALLVVGTLFPLLFDWDSPALAAFSPVEKLSIAFFQSVTSRTAGFNLVDIGLFSTATTMLYMILMFVGANPASTSGGIKIPTIAVLYGYVKDWFQPPRQPVRLFRVNISRFSVTHAIRLLFSTIIFLLCVTLLILMAENQYLMTPDPTINFHKLLFEIISAFGTTGLSLGFAGAVTSLSALLSPLSKFLLILIMLFGRLGALTILAAFFKWRGKKYISQDYPNAQKIQVG